MKASQIENLALQRHASFSRRQFLRGLGACIALPVFESLLPARLLAAAEGAWINRCTRPLGVAFRAVATRVFPSNRALALHLTSRKSTSNLLGFGGGPTCAAHHVPRVGTLLSP